MSTSVRTIKFTSILSLSLLVITYLITVNIECNFIQLNTIWMSNNFLLTVFGGAYASTLVVLLCEIDKYRFDKKNNEEQLFYQTMYLYIELFLMQKNIIDYQSHPNAPIPYNLFDDRIYRIKTQACCIQGIDYSTIIRKNKIIHKHNEFKNATFNKLLLLEQSPNLMRLAVNEEKLSNYENNISNPNIITSSAPKVASLLAEQLKITNALLEEINSFLNVIDDNCNNRFDWNSKHSVIHKKYTHLSCLNENE